MEEGVGVSAARRRRVLIIDDHPITRYGLCQLISQEPDFSVCGEAESAEEAFAKAQSLRPDLVLADLTMPGKGGLELIKDLHAWDPKIATLVMSMHDEGVFAERALRAGARGYIMKNEGGARLLEAMRSVLQGDVFVSRKIMSNLVNALGHPNSKSAVPRPGLLTDREFEVFQMIGQGLSTRQISLRLHVSGKTVGTHRMHMMQKLNLHGGPELIREAVRWAASQQLV